MSTEPIRGLVYTKADVRQGDNWEGKSVVEVRFTYHANEDHESHVPVVMDIGTAIRLVHDLRGVLAGEYNVRTNEFLAKVQEASVDDHGTPVPTVMEKIIDKFAP